VARHTLDECAGSQLFVDLTAEVGTVALSDIDAATAVVLVVLGAGFVDGVRRGLIGAVLEAAATLVALAIACRQYDRVGRLIQFLFEVNTRSSGILGFVTAFIAVSVVAQAIAGVLAKLGSESDVSSADRIIGGVIGLAESLVVAAVILCLILYTPVQALSPHISVSEVSMAIVRAVPALLSQIGIVLPDLFDQSPVGRTVTALSLQPSLQVAPCATRA
jgi:uncharacterized membrane protein required for colicin V production